MKLRNKVLLAIGAAWGVLMGLTYVGSWNFLIKNFIELEQQQVRTNLFRVQESIDQISKGLASFTADWAHWNDAKAFILGTNPSFVSDNINIAALSNSNINLLLYFDKAGQLKVGVAVDLIHRHFIPILDGINRYTYPDSQLLHRTDVNKDCVGFMLLPSGIMIVASSAVTDGDKHYPIVGAMVNARYFSTALLQQVADRTRSRLKLFNSSQIARNPILSQEYAKLSKYNGYQTRIVNDDFIAGYLLIRDVNNTPIGMIRLLEHRDIYKKGVNAINFLLGSFLLLGAVLALLLWWLLRSLIVLRLEKLDRQIAEVSNSNRLELRVDAKGHDELSSVATRVNNMLSIIQSGHEKLEDRVHQRTKELEETNIKLTKEITERHAVEKELLVHKEHLDYLAHYDHLTGLPNRVLFNDLLNKALHNAQRHHKKLAVLFIDLDRFKAINDAYGHHAGDIVLKTLSARFTSVLRTEDTLARLGGDEFILMLTDLEHTNSPAIVAKKLLQVCEQPVILDNREFFLGASIGISIFPEDGNNLETLQKNADMAMYCAKNSGGESYHFFTEEMNLNAHKLIKLEADLRKAITNHELVNYYQPILDLKTNQVMAVETVARWQHPELGLISPGEFIPLAEETGLILKVGEWVLQQACKDNQSWQEQGFKPVIVTVNLSAIQFRQHQLIDTIKYALETSGIAPNCLEVEITESAVMENVETAIAKLKEIQQMGIKIAVDDFGTGYSSISYLKQFPIDVLKIDQSFIKDIPNNKVDMSITNAIIDLAHSLNLLTIAEGVETNEQLDFLRNAGCDCIQGYFFSRPIPADQLIALLEKSAASR